ncbi:hypothetical protein IAE37_005380 [Pseudomonas sp. S31]|uniref:hypothetical protein n=1 Tax=Pseudomonas sp. S31 TaxID=1564473 RepID=UPI001912BEAC|nr:hypothetical protein [Pseudomonas sp. S31]MBK5003104.1 hypothetical protein [Pseudomonas sp. S31]
MSVAWLFQPDKSTKHKPIITGQVAEICDTYISLRNPWVTDSVFMGKLYTAMMVGFAIFTYPEIYKLKLNLHLHEDIIFALLTLSTPAIFIPFIAYRIYLIKNLSNFYLNRHAKKVYYLRIRKLFKFNWSTMKGGVLCRTEFGGSSFSTIYALAFAPPRSDGTFHQKDCLWIDSNEPTDPDIKHVAEVWEYLRHFMDHGPDKLPPPGEPNWWHRPLHAICLTPAEAWRHYAPWRTGEPGEMQGKKNWQLPFWAVLFPYNFSLAVCWYLLCRTFNVRAAPPPSEAFEEVPIKPSKRKRS